MKVILRGTFMFLLRGLAALYLQLETLSAQDGTVFSA
jgi:hypothetical protein